jgi:hypothetical protein
MGIFKKLFGSGNAGSGESSEFETLLDASVKELQAKQEAHKQGWRLGQAKRWDLDQSLGNLIFTFEDGVIATCPAQIIGSFDTKGNTWLWAWANPSIMDSLKRDSLQVKDYGEKHKIERLTSAKWPATETDSWAMAALAYKLCGSQGVYRGPAGPTFVFISFGEVTLSKKQ